MAYHLYVTEALVIRSQPYGESDAQKITFTKDLGLVKARVQSIRRLNSRLRFSLQDFSFSKISYVHGKGGWKIVSAKLQKDLFSVFRDQKAKLEIIGKILLLTEKLIPFDEKNEEIFSALLLCIDDLLKYTNEAAIQNIECVYILRLLHFLGYLTNLEIYTEFISLRPLDEKDMSTLSELRPTLIREINKTMKETHLV